MKTFTLLFLITLYSIIPMHAQEIQTLTLEESITIALENSYSIRSAKYNLIRSQKNLEAMKLGLRTNIFMEFDLPEYNSALQSQFNPTTGKEQFFKIENTTLEGRLFFSQPIVFTNGNFSIISSMFGREQLGGDREYFTNISLSLSQPLFTFNTLQANLDRAEVNLNKSELNFSKAERDIIYNVTAGFYNFYEAKKRLEIAREKVEQTKASYETAQNKFKAGLIAEVEAMQLEVDYASAQNELLSAETRLQESRNNFKLILGLPLEEDLDVVATIEYNPIFVDPEMAIEYALANRPELKNAKSDIYLNQLEVDETKSDGRISAMLNARYGLNKNEDDFDMLFEDMAENRSVTLTLSVPVWDWGQNSRRVEAAEADLKLAELYFENQEDVIKKEILALLNQVEAAKKRVEVLSKSVELAEKSYNISVERFNSGTITSFDLTQMQIRLTDARINSLTALIDYKLALADLARKTFHDYE